MKTISVQVSKGVAIPIQTNRALNILRQTQINTLNNQDTLIIKILMALTNTVR